MYKSTVKPFFDVVVAMLVLLFLSPILFFVTIILAITNGGNAFFFQDRPGLNGKIFRIIKFKTMNDKRDSHGNLLPDFDRFTRVGAFVRKTSLDEIPQLVNVLKGEMSIVGPRPLLIEYLPLYNDFQKKRHLVKPGITGLAQVNGRNALSWEEKFNYDVQYVQEMSFLVDLKIIFKTIKKVIDRKGINADSLITMEMFKGT